MASDGENDHLGFPYYMSKCFIGAERVEFDNGRGTMYYFDVMKKMQQWGDGARALCSYITPDGGHVYNIVNEGGTIKYIDAQRGFVYTDKNNPQPGGFSYLGVPADAFQADLTRVDKAEPTSRVSEYCVGRSAGNGE